ncbi:histidine protein methyltransferase 1 homolog [Glandiceps talaboti]
MDFKFGFVVEENSEPEKNQQDHERRTDISDTNDQAKGEQKDEETSTRKKLKTSDGHATAKEFLLPEVQELTLEEKQVQKLTTGHVEFEVIDSENVEMKLKDKKESHLVKVISHNSDLLPNVYEGGLKIWECSLDLVEFLKDSSINFQDTRVLELGCGAGLPGIFALLHEAEVIFQDYNEEVIQEVTIPNVVLNCKTLTGRPLRCKFMSGDWQQVEDMLSKTLNEDDNKFDIILTSETIYNVDSHDSLHSIMSSLLKSTGTVYLAAKTHYFGVGGGTRMFEELIKKKGIFLVEVVKTYTEGVQREILMMKRK